MSKCLVIKFVVHMIVVARQEYAFLKRKNALVVSTFKLEHNHDSTELAYRRHPRNRCLSSNEIDECSMLFHYGTPTANIKEYARDKCQKFITTADVCNIRRRLRTVLSSMLFVH